MPSAETISNVSGELAMSLPTEEEERLPALLKDLTARKEEVGWGKEQFLKLEKQPLFNLIKKYLAHYLYVRYAQGIWRNQAVL